MASNAPMMGASVTSFGRSIAMEEIMHSTTNHGSHRQRQNGALSAEEVEEGRPVHPSSRELFKKCGGRMNCIRNIPIFGEAIECYNLAFVTSLCTTYTFSKGIAYSIVQTALTAMFLDRYGVSSAEYQRYYTVAYMGWSIKPFTALFSDSFAFFGYKKRWLMTVSAAFAFACSIGFALLPANPSSGIPGAVLSFLVGYGQANLDILSEGLYSRKMRKYPSAGPSLVSSVWISQMVAGIAASFVQGPLSDAGIPQVGLYVCGVCMFLCLPFYVFNGLDESKNKVERHEDAIKMKELKVMVQREAATMKQTSDDDKGMFPDHVEDENSKPPKYHEDVVEVGDLPEEDEEEEELYIPTYCGGAIEFNKEVIVRNWRISVFCVSMTAIVVVTAIVTLRTDTFPLLGTVLGGVVALTGLLFWTLPTVVAKAGLFGFINQALYINITSPLQSFYVAGEACNPGGPNFSFFFYNTITGVIGNVAGTLGVAAFAFIFSKRTYRMTFIVTVTAEVVGSIFDLIMVKRWNLPAIPDHYMYVFGDAVVYQAAYMLAWMPMCILLSQLCPRGSEAMVYALLAALSNYGQTVSGEIGVLLMEWLWPVPANLDTGVCDFDNLWKLIVLGHLVLPFLILVFVFILIPSAKICDELDADGIAVTKDKGIQDNNDDEKQLNEGNGRGQPNLYQLDDPLEETPWFDPIPLQETSTVASREQPEP